MVRITGSGAAGRIKHHLKHNLWRSGASIVIVGFQAQGTTGRRIVDGEKSVKIFREDVAVKAKVFTIGGFSAHADQKELLEWAGNFAESKPRVYVVHGEPTASEALASSIHDRFSMESHIPKWKETLTLEARGAVREREHLEVALPDKRESILRTVTDLEQELERLRQVLLERGEERDIGQDEIDKLQSIREGLREVLQE